MGIVRRSAFAQQNMTFEEKANQIKSWFDRFHSDFISTEILPDIEYVIVTVDNKVNLCIRPDSNYGDSSRWNFLYFGAVKVGEEPQAPYVISSDAAFPTYANMYMTVCINNSTFFLSADTKRDNKHYAFLYENIGVTTYYGQRDYSADVEMVSLSLVTIRDYENINLTYNHTAMLNYQAVLGSVDYTPYSMLTSANESILDSNFLGCSTLTPYQVYTINGQNYFAASANDLFLANNSLED